jgi:glycosyltransferase involved in cell wall biosynthesis
MIVRDEAACLGACLDSVRPYVEELVVVDTGSADDTMAVAKAHGADVVVSFTDCNDPETGLIEDFAKAREFAFSLGAQPWRFWLDGDDVLIGGENFPAVCERYDRERGECAAILAFPYEYDPACHQFRERLVTPWRPELFDWYLPVHESIRVKNADRTRAGVDDALRVVHKKHESKKPIEPHRNMRILRKLYAKMGDSDPRVVFYVGRELSFRKECEDEAIPILAHYVEISGLDEERALACLRLAEVYQGRGDHKSALEWAFRAISNAEAWGECYFAVGRSYYALADKEGDRRNWERAAHFFNLGLAQPPTKTMLFHNPDDRGVMVHRFLNMALNKIGRVEEALESVRTGLAYKPDDTNLLLNRAVYECHLAEKDAGRARETIEKHRATIEAANLKAPQIVVAPEKYAELAKAMAENRIMGLVSAPNQKAAEMAVSSAEGLATPWAAAERERRAGRWVEESRVAVRSFTVSPWPHSPEPLDIVFACPPYSYEPWTPATMREHGIGGSETAIVEMARRLVRMGHRVRVYATPGPQNEGIYDGVEYRQSEEIESVSSADVLVAWRYAEMLEKVRGARLKLLWVHDVFAGNATSARLLLADKILALSNWHAEFLVEQHGIDRRQVHVTRNGIDLSRFDVRDVMRLLVRDPHKVVNSSSPDRSWLSLLRLWPKVRERVPDATLHLFYGFANWEKVARQNPAEKAKLDEIRALLASLEGQGVFYRGRVDQKTLAREFLSAGVWAYPTWFTETSCISAMEAQAAGLALVTSPIAALKETCPADSTYWVEGDWLSESYQERFADWLTAALVSVPSRRHELQTRARERFSWDSVAREWEELFRAEFLRKKTSPIVPYAPHKDFRR